MKRIKTSYPGVLNREVNRIGGKSLERGYYIIFKKDGKVFEEKVGRQYADDMTPAKAARVRAERIENRRKSPKEIRAEKAAAKWTVGSLWQEYSHLRAGRGGGPCLTFILTIWQTCGNRA